MLTTDISVRAKNFSLREPFTYKFGILRYLPYAVVKVSTDTQAAGYGEVAIAPESTGDTRKSAAGAVELLRHHLKGEDPSDTERIVGIMDERLANNCATKAAIEAAVYMIRSEAERVPLHRIIGTKKRDAVEITYTVAVKDPRSVEKKVTAAIGQGFKRIKVKVGTNIETEEEILKAVRGISKLVPVSVDANQGWTSVDEAIANIKRLERYDLAWVEQPIAKDAVKGNRLIRKAVGTPIMLDESIQSVADCEYAIHHEALDMVNIKLAKTGGVINALKIIEACKANDKGYILGSMVDSLLADAVAVHLAACYDFQACEMCGSYLISHDIAEGLALSSGAIRVPDEAGLGITVSPALRALFR
jgi:o-succinylbenzoate synthase